MDSYSSNTGKPDSKIKKFIKANYKVFVLFLVYFTLFFLVSTVVIILLTKPTGTVTVPSVKGEKFSAMYNRITSKELKPTLSFYDTDDIEDGIILDQEPKAGEVVNKESRLKLVVSRNTMFIDVPKLEGGHLQSAKNKLKSIVVADRTVSLPLGVITYVPSDKDAENIVIMQSPKPGQRASLGTKVNLLVSMGATAPEMKMPDVTNQSIDLCFDMLLSKGVEITQEIVPAQTPEQSGIILGQEPAAGTALNKGDKTKLKVAFFQGNTSFSEGYDKFSYKLSNSDDPGFYEIVVKDDFSEKIRYAATNKPGDTISFVFYRMGNAKATISVNKKYIKSMNIKMTDF